MALSKQAVEALLREGVGYTEEVDASELEEGATLEVRGLTRGEVTKVNAKATAGQSVTASAGNRKGSKGKRSDGGDQITIDLEKAGIAAEEAEMMEAAFGLSVSEKWTVRDVEGLPPKLVSRVVTKVRELTGGEVMTNAVDQFRQDAGRDDADD